MFDKEIFVNLIKRVNQAQLFIIKHRQIKKCDMFGLNFDIDLTKEFVRFIFYYKEPMLDMPQVLLYIPVDIIISDNWETELKEYLEKEIY